MTYIGELPGYYYDKERNKYFKVQPDHNAPSNAKYSVSSIAREQHQAKKIKLQQNAERKRRKQTVHRPWSERHPLLIGTGLQRERGILERSKHHALQSGAMVQSLEHSCTTIGLNGFTPRKARLTDIIAHQEEASRSIVSICHDSSSSHAIYNIRSPEPGQSRHRVAHEQPLAAFSDKVVSLSINRICGVDVLFACSSQAQYGNQNVHLQPVFRSDIGPDQVTGARSHATSLGFSSEGLDSGEGYCVGNFGESLWSAAVHRHSHRFAFSGSRTVTVNSLEASDGFKKAVSIRLADNEESFACEWLSPNTLAFSLRKEYDPHSRMMRMMTPPLSARNQRNTAASAGLVQEVKLWDVRANAVASRLRGCSRITGLKVTDHDPEFDIGQGNYILLSHTYGLCLHDLRILKPEAPPLLEIEHASPASQLEFAVLRQPGIVAAVDKVGAVQTYSLHTGRAVRTLKMQHCPGFERLRVDGLRWCRNHNDVPFLQACVGNSVQRWSWDSGLDDSCLS